MNYSSMKLKLKETVFLKMNLFDNLIFGPSGNFKKLYSLQWNKRHYFIFLEQGQMLSSRHWAYKEVFTGPNIIYAGSTKALHSPYFLCLTLPRSIFCTDTLLDPCYMLCTFLGLLCSLCPLQAQNEHNRIESVFGQHQDVFGHHSKCA